jgi:TRAP-type C4-dicarboxylate transport system permease small subunit
VTLVLGRLKGRALHALEMWALSAAALLSGLLAWYSIRLAWNSRAFNDISTGNDATPLWIPQIAMALGAVILLVAFIDEWWLEFTGKRVVTQSEEALHNE